MIGGQGHTDRSTVGVADKVRPPDAQRIHDPQDELYLPIAGVA